MMKNNEFSNNTLLINSLSFFSPVSGISRYTFEILTRIHNNKDKNFKTVYWYGFYTPNLLMPWSYKLKFIKFSHTFLSYFPSIKNLIKNFILNKTRKYSNNSKDKNKKEKITIFWEPHNYISFNLDNNIDYLITTVHDFSVLINPKWHLKERLEIYKKQFPLTLEKSDYIITVSNFIKDELIKYYNYPPEKIKVIYEGISEVFKKYFPEELKIFKKKINLPDDFILFVGTIEPRKNIENLIKAYLSLSSDYRKNHKLVLVGNKGWENKNIFKLINENKKDIIYLGYINNQELAYIYNLAEVFVYPSYYEGFGIPPIEAMACETPVIVSNKASLPEVCGDAALYVDPYNIDDIRDKIKYILENKELKINLVKKGLERIKNFSWDKCALEHIQFFNSIFEK